MDHRSWNFTEQKDVLQPINTPLNTAGVAYSGGGPSGPGQGAAPRRRIAAAARDSHGRRLPAADGKGETNIGLF